MLSKAFKTINRPSAQLFKTITFQPTRNLWFFAKRNAQPETAGEIQYDEATIEKLKNPQLDLVKPGKEKIVGWWLLATAGAVFFMIVLGGYTRLSGSGLSMTKWRPIGYRYPKNVEQWEEEFENYKKYPEYLLANKNISLEDFKTIFLVEYSHRTFGNFIGGLFGFPLAYFLARGYIRPKLRNRCLGLFAFGGLQGLIGWWMVKSGMEEKPQYQTKPRVSSYRLFVHLNAAILIYAALFWNGLNLIRPSAESAYNKQWSSMKSARGKMIMLLHFVALNIMSGVQVAGIDAGRVYNTWPDMNGAFIPSGYWKVSPAWRNFFENMGTVQFNHRMFAYLTYVSSAYLYYLAQKGSMSPVAKRAVTGFFLLVNLQVILGITALLRQVPVPECVTHQANAVMVLSAALYTMHALRKPSPRYLNYLQHTMKNIKNTP